MSITVKRGDTHSIDLKINTDLTGCTARLIARLNGTGPVINLPVVISGEPASGVLKHTLTGDLAIGTYSVEVEVVRPHDKATFPNNGYETIIVIQDLDQNA